MLEIVGTFICINFCLSFACRLPIKQFLSKLGCAADEVVSHLVIIHEGNGGMLVHLRAKYSCEMHVMNSVKLL